MKHLPWILCCCGIVLVAVLTFTPLVIPVGVHKPSLGPLPYSLWMGFLSVALMVGITFIGTRVHPANEEEELL